MLDSVSRPDKSTKLSSLTSYPILASWEGTLVKQVYTAGADPTWCENIKKGILSLLQIQRQSGTVTEVRHWLMPTDYCSHIQQMTIPPLTHVFFQINCQCR